MPLRNYLEEIDYFLRVNPLSASLLDFMLCMVLAPLFTLRHFGYFRKYRLLYRETISKHKKMVLISFSHISEKRFAEKLIGELNSNPDIRLAIFCGHPGVSREDIEPFYPGIPVFPYGFLPLVKASLFLTTKTSLTWHRPFLTKKVHIFHSPVSMHQLYAEGSFDGFDIFFAIGPHHKKELGAYMPKRGKKNIRIFEIGCEVIDKLLNSQVQKTTGRIKTVIYAPSWGEESSLAINGKEIIAKLLNLDLKVIFRPHSLSYKVQKGLIADISFAFSGKEHFSIDKADNSNFIDNSVDLMISDWSGAAFEFALGYHKPVVFIDTPQKIFNRNWPKYLIEPGVEFEYRNRLGSVIRDPEELPVVIKCLNQNYAEFSKRITDCSSELLYHPGNSSAYAYKAVLDILSNR